jgi:cytochrome c oxidase assembly protein subunit 15
MSDTRIEQPLVPRALHWWAVLTVAATVCLLALGAVVTTFRVGMADPVWPTYPWHLLLISYDEPSAGFLIEHTHRLAGYVVGCCVIVLAVWLAVAARADWLKRIGWVALVCVILQGVLGGFRVRLNALVGTDLAALHGVFAQVVFSLFVGIAVCTSRAFARPAALEPGEARSLRRLALTLTACTFLQLVWGSLTRHTFHPLAQRLHFLTAFVVLAAVAWFVKAVWDSPAARERLGFAALLLSVLVALQIMLGVEAWLARFGTGELPELQQVTTGQAAVRTAHVLIGSWLLAISVSCTLLVGRVREPQATADAGTLFEPQPRTDAIHAGPPAAGVHHLEASA